jgi:hypothetical protein
LRVIPELNVANVNEPNFLRRAIEQSEEDFLKLWIHYLGPESILAWAAGHNPAIKWEGLYAHRCQSCQRLYQDDAVRDVVREHWEEMVGQILQASWLDEMHVPATLSRGFRTTTGGDPLTERNQGSVGSEDDGALPIGDCRVV